MASTGAETAGSSGGQPQHQSASSLRLVSLDAFRGFAILLMLLVNNFGLTRYTPKQLQHANWAGGIHLADLAFPWFLFCVGIAIPFSYASAKRRSVPQWQYDLRILRRVLILLALGALLDTTGDRKLTFFSVGILQTIAIAYLVGAWLYDLPIYRRIVIALAGLIAYWVLLKFIPIPGVGAGAFSEQQNVILHLNRAYLGKVGLWNLPRLIPTSSLVLIGTAIGDLVRYHRTDKIWTVKAILASGFVLSAAAFLWSLSIPFNKPIWTPSYILVSAGTGALLLGLMYLVTDYYGIKNWSFPLVVFGSNAILAYVLPILSKDLFFRPLGIYIGGWFRVSLFVVFWWFIVWILYKKKLFLRA